MNSDEIRSLIVKILLMVISPLAVQMHIDGNTSAAVVGDIADIVVLGYGVYSHWNMAKVPEKAMVTVPGSAVPVVATAVPK